MSVATLKAELLRELAAAVLGGDVGARRRGAGTDLINWNCAGTNLTRQLVFLDHGADLISTHVLVGVHLWFSPGTLAAGAPHRAHVYDIVCSTPLLRLFLDDLDSESRSFVADVTIAHFLSNVLDGHVQDA